MNRYAYKSEIKKFLKEKDEEIFGQIVKNSENHSESRQQLNSWNIEIQMLKKQLEELNDGYIGFEYTIPRIGKRADVIVLYKGIVFLLEFKVGEAQYRKNDINQVTDYALDLKNFHKESNDKYIIPILIATNANEYENKIKLFEDKIHETILTNGKNLNSLIGKIVKDLKAEEFDYEKWFESEYRPTPTIIEAAQYMYKNKNVENISKKDAEEDDLKHTSEIIKKVIEESERNNQKSICFITGVPGAGKTLAGLNIANETQKFEEEKHAVFLSGNYPLVKVLQEALARDPINLNKREALRKSEAFIQMIHHFRNNAVETEKPPHEKVVIFDEAQRAWDKAKLSKFMKKRKDVLNFNMSEPEFLIEYMNRHKEWSVIICLIGGGQEINTGEVGIQEWFNVLSSKYTNWNVYVSDKIYDEEYTNGKDLNEILNTIENLHIEEKLHLAVSTRSFRSEKQADLVKSILNLDTENAKKDFIALKEKYPIFLTRDIEKAKKWIKTKARGTERYGIVASSGAKRLRKNGICLNCSIDPIYWFLNNSEDVRSSFALEQAATEFDIQGLELDWTIVGWDANLRLVDGCWKYYSFKGTKWNNINKEEERRYLKNAYRVILTRARQGMIIYIPYGDIGDTTALPDFYDGVYRYLKEIGVEEI